ncbi:MAG TPA: threonine/serine dehydratase [Longimicrobiales bacterium]|nr:threonine/serine dehydratase [Longimicrobiales bacterium]
MTDRPAVPDLATWPASRWDDVRDRVRGLVPPTPCVRFPDLGACYGGEIFLKLENLQRTGSFKVRGAISKLTALAPEDRAGGVVACSSGNHGRAVAWVAGQLDVPATIFVPEWVDPVKLAGMRGDGADVRLVGTRYDEAAAAAHDEVDRTGRPFVHPFDDVDVAAGQGTTALEILDAVPDVRHVVVCLSGGGLAGGVAAALRAHGSEAEVVAVSAERARVMFESLKAGRPLELEEEATIASALSGGIELENRVTFDLVRRHVDRHLVVSEEAIERAMAIAARHLHMVVEGGGAVGLAALFEGMLPPEDREGPTVVIVSGGNVGAARLAEIATSA